MGLCFSKKQHAKRREEQPPSDAKRSGARKAARNTAVAGEAKKTPPAKAPAPAPAKKAVAKPEEPAADKRTVFVVKAAPAAAAAEVAATGSGPNAEEVKRAAPEAEAKPGAVGRTPVRTSSCTKEEVDAILIQCGRLSRSSSASGKAPSAEHGRRYAGSKRSYDFDHDRRGAGADDDCHWGREGTAASSRPSPRRRTPERKRSASHDGRTGSGSGSRSRRVSRSPGRRAEGAPVAASSGAGERAARQQPGKMVSVPARDKGRAPSPVKAASGDKGRAPSPVKAVSGKRYPSPRASSPARGAGNENAGAQPAHGPVLSRSSSRKAEQSPYRRNPMAELDENALGINHNDGITGKAQKKSVESTIVVPQKAMEQPKDPVPSCRASKEKTEIVEEAVASNTKGPSSKMNATHSVSIVAESAVNPRTGPGSRSSRRSSRDFDHNGNSYASLLLEDIHNYHQQNNSSAAAAAPAFSLPACVSKACSILEAVADLNSTSSENKSFELDRSVNDKESVNGRYGGKAAGSCVVESEVVVKDDLMEPSLHKYVSVRDIRRETEPQESAGSNSFTGNAWTCSWEPTSVDSTDRTRSVSQSYSGEEVEQQCTEESWQSKQKPSSQEPSLRGPTPTTSNVQVQRGRVAHRGTVSVRTDARGVSAGSSVV